VDEDRPVPVRGGKSAVENSGVSPFTSDAEAAVLWCSASLVAAGQPPSAFSYPSSSDIWGARPEYGIFLQVGKLQFSKESIPEVDRVSKVLVRSEKEIFVPRLSS
jgi:hypothetical protein